MVLGALKLLTTIATELRRRSLQGLANSNTAGID